MPGKNSLQHFRLPIDRAFAIKGFGTVVTGTLVSGSVTGEDEVELFPAQKRIRVRGVQSEGKSASRATAGQRTALNLAGVELSELARGMTLTAAGKFEPTQRVDVRLTLLSGVRALKNHARVHFHHFTSETVAEVVLLEGAAASGTSALAQLRLKEPVLALPQDRFIVRQFSPLVTIGGGVILDNHAARHRKAEETAARVTLEALESGQQEKSLAALVTAEPRGLTLADAVGRTGWMETDLRTTISALEKAGTLKLLTGDGGGLLVTTASLTETVKQTKAELEKFHAANPLVPGIAKEDLRERVAAGQKKRALAPEIYRAALDILVASGDVTEEAKAKEQIEREFELGGLAVPSVKEVLGKLSVETKRAQKILQILLREKTLVKISEELIFHRNAITRLRELLAAHKKQKGERLAIAVFKEITGISRKYAIPLLEYLDRERVTRRVGDERIIL
ncbi:MAG: SelB C-terminal domain-containing protein [Acidobacteria bacterium]|nr:SelB C-terminal domain-containing protein [Acidobacteriota bacterium]